MPLTLGLTGMDPATETALQTAFKQANAAMNERFSLAPEADADYVVVDMDSMYGPMSWLRLHGAGKTVIGLTSAPRTQADFRLGRPFDAGSLDRLLHEIADQAGVPVAAAPAASAAPPPASPIQAEPVLPAAPPSGFTHAPEPQDRLPEEVPEPVDAEMAAPAPEPLLMPEPPAARPPTGDPTFADWLAPSALSQRLRYRRPAGPNVLIDPKTRQYHGPATLKPLAGYFEGPVRLTDFDALDDATWAREAAAAGEAQPLSRLQWYGGLLAGKGELLAGYDPAGRYRLNKWPQTEREFPKHFRIATAMMKGPATLDEIAAASGVPRGEVADFVNANLTTGFAENVADTPPEPSEPAKSGGLFGRLRGK